MQIHSVGIDLGKTTNPGNSGGPLIDIHVEVIGMNTMIASESGGN